MTAQVIHRRDASALLKRDFKAKASEGTRLGEEIMRAVPLPNGHASVAGRVTAKAQRLAPRPIFGSREASVPVARKRRNVRNAATVRRAGGGRGSERDWATRAPQPKRHDLHQRRRRG